MKIVRMENGQKVCYLLKRAVKFLTRSISPSCQININGADDVEFGNDWDISKDECPASLLRELSTGETLDEIYAYQGIDDTAEEVCEELNEFFPIAIKRPENVAWLESRDYILDYSKYKAELPGGMLKELNGILAEMHCAKDADRKKELEHKAMSLNMMILFIMGVEKIDLP